MLFKKFVVCFLALLFIAVLFMLELMLVSISEASFSFRLLVGIMLCALSNVNLCLSICRYGPKMIRVLVFLILSMETVLACFAYHADMVNMTKSISIIPYLAVPCCGITAAVVAAFVVPGKNLEPLRFSDDLYKCVADVVIAATVSLLGITACLVLTEVAYAWIVLLIIPFCRFISLIIGISKENKDIL
ncbi:MAG: hypothetical protein IJM18_08165 [Clostridia bacterium]|nr:hypothetical protein [Clostridia bacterium]